MGLPEPFQSVVFKNPFLIDYRPKIPIVKSFFGKIPTESKNAPFPHKLAEMVIPEKISRKDTISRLGDWQGNERRIMLVLSRKKDESIIVRIPGQEDIRLTVVRIDNMNKVRIGVEADKEVVILRAELEDVREELSEVK